MGKGIVDRCRKKTSHLLSQKWKEIFFILLLGNACACGGGGATGSAVAKRGLLYCSSIFVASIAVLEYYYSLCRHSTVHAPKGILSTAKFVLDKQRLLEVSTFLLKKSLEILFLSLLPVLLLPGGFGQEEVCKGCWGMRFPLFCFPSPDVQCSGMVPKFSEE